MAKKIKFPLVLDVSGWKGEINWNDVHPCPDLVICHTSDGIQERDDFFPIYWNNLKQLKIKRGASHILNPEIDSQTQVDHYLNTVEQAGGFDKDSISPILDLSNIQCNPRKIPLEKRIRQFLEKIESYTGKMPIIFISRRFWGFLKDRSGNYPSWSDDYLLWVPWYPSDPNIYRHPPINTLPNGWENWAIWRYDECATISGIKGYVSLSTLSQSYATQLDLLPPDNNISCKKYRRHIIYATIVASEGVIIRKEFLWNSKMLAFLAEGSQLSGESIEFINGYEAWLRVTKPVVGWCPIVDTGKIYLSIRDSSQSLTFIQGFSTVQIR